MLSGYEKAGGDLNPRFFMHKHFIYLKCERSQIFIDLKRESAIPPPHYSTEISPSSIDKMPKKIFYFLLLFVYFARRQNPCAVV